MGTVVEVKSESCDSRCHVSSCKVPTDADAGYLLVQQTILKVVFFSKYLICTFYYCVLKLNVSSNVVLVKMFPCVQISDEPRVENCECQQVIVGDPEHRDVVSEEAVRVEVGSKYRRSQPN